MAAPSSTSVPSQVLLQGSMPTPFSAAANASAAGLGTTTVTGTASLLGPVSTMGLNDMPMYFGMPGKEYAVWKTPAQRFLFLQGNRNTSRTMGPYQWQFEALRFMFVPDGPAAQFYENLQARAEALEDDGSEVEDEDSLLDIFTAPPRDAPLSTKEEHYRSAMELLWKLLDREFKAAPTCDAPLLVRVTRGEHEHPQAYCARFQKNAELYQGVYTRQQLASMMLTQACHDALRIETQTRLMAKAARDPTLEHDLPTIAKCMTDAWHALQHHTTSLQLMHLYSGAVDSRPHYVQVDPYTGASVVSFVPPPGGSSAPPPTNPRTHSNKGSSGATSRAAPGASSNRASTKPRYYCEVHGPNNSHPTVDCVVHARQQRSTATTSQQGSNQLRRSLAAMVQDAVADAMQQALQPIDIAHRAQALMAATNTHPPPRTAGQQQRPQQQQPARSRCAVCHKSGHTSNECWTLHPELRPGSPGQQPQQSTQRRVHFQDQQRPAQANYTAVAPPPSYLTTPFSGHTSQVAPPSPPAPEPVTPSAYHAQRVPRGYMVPPTPSRAPRARMPQLAAPAPNHVITLSLPPALDRSLEIRVGGAEPAAAYTLPPMPGLPQLQQDLPYPAVDAVTHLAPTPPEEEPDGAPQLVPLAEPASGLSERIPVTRPAAPEHEPGELDLNASTPRQVSMVVPRQQVSEPHVSDQLPVPLSAPLTAQPLALLPDQLPVPDDSEGGGELPALEASQPQGAEHVAAPPTAPATQLPHTQPAVTPTHTARSPPANNTTTILGRELRNNPVRQERKAQGRGLTHNPPAKRSLAAAQVSSTEAQDEVRRYLASRPTMYYLTQKRPEGGLVLEVGGQQYFPELVVIDTGSEVSLLNARTAKQLPFDTQPTALRMRTSAGRVEPALGEVSLPVSVTLRQGTWWESRVDGFPLFLTDGASTFDLLVGLDILHAFAASVDPYTQFLIYRPFLHSHHDAETVALLPVSSYDPQAHDEPTVQSMLRVSLCSVSAGTPVDAMSQDLTMAGDSFMNHMFDTPSDLLMSQDSSPRDAAGEQLAANEPALEPAAAQDAAAAAAAVQPVEVPLAPDQAPPAPQPPPPQPAAQAAAQPAPQAAAPPPPPVAAVQPAAAAQHAPAAGQGQAAPADLTFTLPTREQLAAAAPHFRHFLNALGINPEGGLQAMGACAMGLLCSMANMGASAPQPSPPSRAPLTAPAAPPQHTPHKRQRRGTWQQSLHRAKLEKPRPGMFAAAAPFAVPAAPVYAAPQGLMYGAPPAAPPGPARGNALPAPLPLPPALRTQHSGVNVPQAAVPAPQHVDVLPVKWQISGTMEPSELCPYVIHRDLLVDVAELDRLNDQLGVIGYSPAESDFIFPDSNSQIGFDRHIGRLMRGFRRIVLRCARGWGIIVLQERILEWLLRTVHASTIEEELQKCGLPNFDFNRIQDREKIKRRDAELSKWLWTQWRRFYDHPVNYDVRAYFKRTDASTADGVPPAAAEGARRLLTIPEFENDKSEWEGDLAPVPPAPAGGGGLRVLQLTMTVLHDDTISIQLDPVTPVLPHTHSPVPSPAPASQPSQPSVVQSVRCDSTLNTAAHTACYRHPCRLRCSHCHKVGHEASSCWELHPELRPAKPPKPSTRRLRREAAERKAAMAAERQRRYEQREAERASALHAVKSVRLSHRWLQQLMSLLLLAAVTPTLSLITPPPVTHAFRASVTYMPVNTTARCARTPRTAGSYLASLAPHELYGYTPTGAEGVVPLPEYTKDTEHGWIWGNHPGTTPEQRAALRNEVLSCKSAFAYSLQDLGTGYQGDVAPMEIRLKPGSHFYTPPRRYSELDKQIRDEKCHELRDAGFIRKLDPPVEFASAPVLAAKKDANGVWSERRFCIDYRAANACTIPDRYNLHRPEDIFAMASQAKIFSKLDLRAGFHQLPIARESQPATAFWWGNELWCYTRTAFGSRNSPAYFQRVMDHELHKSGCSAFAVAYIDDVLIFSSSPEEHIKHVGQVLRALHSCGLRAHPDKSVFGSHCIEFLGHNLSHEGISPHEVKVKAIAELRVPTNLDELRSALGFLSYYRCYLPRFSQIARPLTHMMGKGVPFNMGPTEIAAFEALKRGLTEPGRVLRHFDPALPIKLYTDWSQDGLSAILHQVGAAGKEHLVACVSRSLNKHERNYEAFKGELLAAVWGMKVLRPYLHGLHFQLITDHAPLEWLMSNQNLAGQAARWAMLVQEYDFQVIHRPGVTNIADHPSRSPMPDNADHTGARMDGTAEAEPDVASGKEHDHSVMQQSAVAAACLAAVSSLPPVSAVADASDLAEATELSANPFVCLFGQDAVDAALEPVSTPQAHAEHLRRQAQGWVKQAVTSQAVDLTSTPQVPASDTLDLGLVGRNFFAASHSEQGVVVVELFGGMCAGLEALLRLGCRVSHYYYCDKDPAAQRIAAHRINGFKVLYPHLLPESAVADAFTALPQDVYDITADHLAALPHGPRDQWIIIAGWECQDLSPAGLGRGLQGPRSRTFYPLVQVMQWAQQLCAVRPAHFIENAALEHNFQNPEMAMGALKEVEGVLGKPVILDAVRVGSYAHRLRSYWTNLVPAAWLQSTLDLVERDPERTISDILHPWVEPIVSPSSDKHPFYPVNKQGEPVRVWPTFVTVPQSRGFRPHTKGWLVDRARNMSREPNVTERELAMGYAPDSTAAKQTNISDRFAVLGRAMDAYAMEALFSTSEALAATLPWVAQSAMGQVTHSELQQRVPRGYQLLKPHFTPAELAHPLPAALTGEGSRRPPGLGSTPAPSAGRGRHAGRRSRAKHTPLQPVSFVAAGVQAGGASSNESVCPATAALARAALPPADRAVVHSMSLIAEAMDPHPERDIWEDHLVLHLLREGVHAPDSMPREQQRAARRARFYTMQGDILMRRMPDGSVRVVPPPDRRAEIVKQVHEQTGHFGANRTAHLVSSMYWWPGLTAQVRHHCAHCMVCDRSRTPLSADNPQLQPLPVMGLFYRWGVDLAGPITPKSAQGNTYIMIAIEHFSKHIEAVPIPGKDSAVVAHAFLSHVLARYGSPAEVLTDQGNEFQGAFQRLMEQSFIDHRTTSAYNPQADGLAERAVQTVKRSLRKMAQQREEKQRDRWEEDLQYTLLGYRCSEQQSTGFSPHYMLHGVHPIVPPAARRAFTAPVDLDDTEQAARFLMERAAALHASMPIAAGNLLIAQHRDTLRYARRRGGGFRPRLHRYQPGDLVYLKNFQAKSTLDLPTRPEILQIEQVNPSGTLVLRGQDKTTVVHHMRNVTPCHLPHVDLSEDSRLAKFPLHAPCQVCNYPDRFAQMLVCEQCFTGWHMDCLDPPLTSIPEGDWLCPRCRPVQSVSALSSVRVPAHWDWAQPGSVADALQLLMPGTYSAAHVTRLAASMPGQPQFLQDAHQPLPGQPECVQTLPAEVAPLLDALDLSSCVHIVDPWCGTGGVFAACAERGLSIVRNDINPRYDAEFHMDALQPAFYQALHARGIVPDAIVMSPWFRVLDIALPLAVLYATRVVAAHVPGHYLTNAHPARLAYLKRLQQQGRLAVLTGLPRGATGLKCIWLLVFRDSHLRASMLRRELPSHMVFV
jgi:hypothetical protein